MNIPNPVTRAQPAFAPAALRALANAYPEQPVALDHALADHPLLTLESLVGLAQRMPASSVEYNPATNLPIGIAPDAVPQSDLSIVETIRSIEDNGSWMVIKWIEQDAVYGALLESILAELRPVVEPVTGKMMTHQAFIFISSPGAVTPFHFDPEHNILLQIRGSKTMTVFPATDDELAGALDHEAYHLGGHRNLNWKDSFTARAREIPLAPGQAVHMPVKAPHWVKVGPDVSISLSVTWRSAWSYREADARAFNHLLRRCGLAPRSPGRFPAQNYLKSFGWRLWRRSGRRIGL